MARPSGTPGASRTKFVPSSNSNPRSQRVDNLCNFGVRRLAAALLKAVPRHRTPKALVDQYDSAVLLLRRRAGLRARVDGAGEEEICVGLPIVGEADDQV